MNEGDIVKLQSGGPRMTIESIENGQFANLVWFHPDTNEIQRTRVNIVTLKAV